MREFNAIQVDCPGIVNLFFNINGFDYEKGIYLCDSVNQMIDLYDMITIRISRFKEKGIFLRGFRDIPINNNSVYLAAKKFFEVTQIDIPHVDIEIKKIIPVNSGMHGRISDAVGTLFALNELFNTNLTHEELMSFATKIDKYAPYFVFGGIPQKGIPQTGIAHTNIEGVKPIFDHVFNNYIIAIPKFPVENNIFDTAKNLGRFNNEYNPQCLFNCVTSIMPEELKKLQDFISQSSDLDHGLLEMSSNYLIALRDDKNMSDVVLNINKYFPKYKLLTRKNTSNYKFVRMYR